MPEPVLLMSYSLGIGGTERQLSEMARALDRRKFTPHVACLRDSGFRADELRRAGVPVLHLPISSFGSWSAIQGAMTLRNYFREHGIRLVHTFDYPTTDFAVPVARFCRLPAVLSSVRGHRDLIPGWHRRFVKVTDHMVHGIVVNCEFLKQRLMLDEGVAERKIHLCYNGINSSAFDSIRKKLPQLNDASLVIGTVAVLRPEKGIDVLIKAFAALQFSGAKLVIVGDGEERAALEAMVAKLGLNDRVRLQPAVENVAEWLASFDIFVLPSHSEALSNSLMEAMAAGCAVVASAIGGNPELVAPDVTGVLFNDGDVPGLTENLLKLAANPERRRRMGESAAACIRDRFSVERAAGRMGEVYRNLLAQRR